MSTITIEFVYPNCVNCGHVFGVSQAVWNNCRITCPVCGRLARTKQERSAAKQWEDECSWLRDCHDELEKKCDRLERQVRGYRGYFKAKNGRKL